MAFSAYASSDVDYDDGSIVAFETVVTNIGGYYNNEASLFTCPTNGLYLFSLSLLSDGDNSMLANIVKEGTLLLRAFSNGAFWDQGSTTVVIECLAFQSVRVECSGDNRRILSGRDSSFTGVLITPYV